ncbi:MAG: hypothetical protein MJZ26_08315 [Fibrobacter sp.]|nr:hypothetical protein [Fibrobacter sp.]
MKTVLLLLAMLIPAVFLGCVNSDDYLFDENDARDISIDAFMTESFDTAYTRNKTATICPGDSLIFLTEIYPSKSIRRTRYYWTLDGKPFANEYSFKNTVTEPGSHKIAFVFVDYFGDTLSDTLHLYVATPPSLVTENIIPANNSQEFSPNDIISFAWTADDPDSLWDVFYHFKLQEASSAGQDSSKILVDTVITKTNFSYLGELKPLTKYQWVVSASNELNQSSRDTVYGTLFTAGYAGEGGVQGNLAASSNEVGLKYHLILQDSLEQTVVDKIQESSGFGQAFFSIAPLVPGDYLLKVSLDSYPDFGEVSTHAKVINNKLTLLDTIRLIDNVKTAIRHVSNNDSLDIADTLKFIVKDGGGKVLSSRISVRLESIVIPEIFLDNDTLVVPLNSIGAALNQSWSTRTLIVTTLDMSGNKTTRTFFLRPNSTLPEVIQ